MSFGPLFAFVHPLDLEWWCSVLANAQAAGEGFHTIDYSVDLMADQVMAIEDVFPNGDVPPNGIRLKQLANPSL